jgi:hypothetical protein
LLALSTYVTGSALAANVAALRLHRHHGRRRQLELERRQRRCGVWHNHGTTIRVLDLLKVVDRRMTSGVLYGGDELLRKLSYSVLAGLLEAGAVMA